MEYKQWDAERKTKARETAIEMDYELVSFENALVNGVPLAETLLSSEDAFQSKRELAEAALRVIYEDGADRPCNKIGAYIADVKKVASDPVLSVYRKAYRRLHKRVELGYIEDDEFMRWKDEATQKRDQCLAGELDAEEFLAWVDVTSRRR